METLKITVDKTPPVFDDSKSSVGGVAGAAAVSGKILASAFRFRTCFRDRKQGRNRQNTSVPSA